MPPAEMPGDGHSCTQASTPHLSRFGCVEVPAEEYLKLLKKAIGRRCQFD